MLYEVASTPSSRQTSRLKVSTEKTALVSKDTGVQSGPDRRGRCRSRRAMPIRRAPGRTAAGSTRGTRRNGAGPTTTRSPGTSRRSSQSRFPEGDRPPRPSCLLRGERITDIVAESVTDMGDQ